MNIYSKEVHSFEEFVDAISVYQNIIENKSKEGGKRFTPVFRGTHEKPNDDRYLKPTLSWNKLVKYEYDLISEIKRIRPLDFHQLADLDLIGKCQHYRLHTRFLDFSRSEYVALFFAVNSVLTEIEENEISKVYCLFANMQNDITPKKIAQIATRMESWMYDTNAEKQYFLEDIICPKDIAADNRSKEVYDFINKTLRGPIFSYPKFYTAREQNQQSVFMVAPNKIIDTAHDIDFETKEWDKKLKEGSCIGRFMFKDELYDPFSSLYEVEENKSKMCDFWEIKFNHNVRKEMKKRLESLGVDAAYIFTDDLEYVARRIARDFEKYKGS